MYAYSTPADILILIVMTELGIQFATSIGIGGLPCFTTFIYFYDP